MDREEARHVDSRRARPRAHRGSPRHHGRAAQDAGDDIRSAVFALKVAQKSVEIVDEDFTALRAHGVSDEDIWDIGAIAAFFALSNRMANLIAMRPNDEFHLLGRLPRKP